MTVFEREDKVGGLLRYGIPNMKLEKQYYRPEGKYHGRGRNVHLSTNCNIGKDKKASSILKEFDRVVLCCGASQSKRYQSTGTGRKRNLFRSRFSEVHDESTLGKS